MNSGYRLLDFGQGRRLEAFAELLIDRPCPLADRAVSAAPQLWSSAHARFERTGDEQGLWHTRQAAPDRWEMPWQHLRFELKRTEAGQVGLFPEQAGNWEWVARQVAAFGREKRDRSNYQASTAQGLSPSPAGVGPMRVLNLFGYTGGSTLSAAAAGAEVVHVDAAKNIVAWARRNALLSGLEHAPIRWIVEDAAKFVRRELARGNRYDAVILDPPSYGHGAHGEVWRLGKHLPRLLRQCGQLTAERRTFMLLTCHTPGYPAERLSKMLAEALDEPDLTRIHAEELSIRSVDGRELPSGAMARWQTSAVT